MSATNHSIRRAAMGLAVLAVAMLTLAACGGKKQECGDPSKGALDDCKGKQTQLQEEVNNLKRQLAQALANPGSIKVDPTVLMINGEVIMPKVQEGNLSQEQVVETIQLNKKVLKACYERALKKNGNLRRQSITLTLAFTVKPSGNADGISVRPNYDSLMIDCMQKAIQRWRFPNFTGQPVGVESPLTLTPKNK